MSVEAVAAVGMEQPVMPESLMGIQPPMGASFETVLGSLETLNTQLMTSQNATARLASADAPESLHHTVMGMEQTRLSFELMLAVRNKTLDAYQELMRMQV
ncbi:MAG TPA: flagellar hook-basal body complex protein FliE [Steroidobacteraceae bacterium]|nr:flagellar hook-basal body complex protein FliE [Steroidobacteraceae bacterium]